MEQKVNKYKYNLKISQGMQKGSTYLKIVHKFFWVGERMHLKLKPKGSTRNLGKCVELPPRLYRPFEILFIIGIVAYQLAFLVNIRVHILFHVCLLNK